MFQFYCIPLRSILLLKCNINLWKLFYNIPLRIIWSQMKVDLCNYIKFYYAYLFILQTKHLQQNKNYNLW